VRSIINLEEEGLIRSVRVIDLNISHSWINDLTVTLQEPEGQKVLLFDQICGNENTINLTFGQDGADHANLPCPPESEETFQPKQSFDVFEDLEISGEWTVIIKDHFNLDGGQLNSWALEVCKEVKEDIPLTIIINDATVTLVEPEPITVISTITEPTCVGGNNGNIIINPTGGKAPFQYMWQHGPTRETVNNLPVLWNYLLRQKMPALVQMEQSIYPLMVAVHLILSLGLII